MIKPALYRETELLLIPTQPRDTESGRLSKQTSKSIQSEYKVIMKRSVVTLVSSL